MKYIILLLLGTPLLITNNAWAGTSFKNLSEAITYVDLGGKIRNNPLVSIEQVHPSRSFIELEIDEARVDLVLNRSILKRITRVNNEVADIETAAALCDTYVKPNLDKLEVDPQHVANEILSKMREDKASSPLSANERTYPSTAMHDYFLGIINNLVLMGLPATPEVDRRALLKQLRIEATYFSDARAILLRAIPTEDIEKLLANAKAVTERNKEETEYLLTQIQQRLARETGAVVFAGSMVID